jgi:hypothetical protein
LLDSQLDETTIVMLDASHNYVLHRDGSELTWLMDNVYLPGQLESEIESQGYVHFKIKPKTGYAAGDVIPNTAGIYFDGNEVVETNNAPVAFVTTLGHPEFGSNSIKVYPNPANTLVNVEAGEALQTIRITDMLGKKIIESQPLQNQAVIDVSQLGSGLYLIEITASNKKTTKKLVIK